MVCGRRVVALIPARGGSKRVPDKNLLPFAGKPLSMHTIELALSIPEIDQILVSTDSVPIADLARGAGVEVSVRPERLATDEARMSEVVRHLLQEQIHPNENEIALLLQPTSPLRSASDVLDCAKLVAGDFDSAATFARADVHPEQAWRVSDEGGALAYRNASIAWVNSQELDPAFRLTGSVYALTRSFLNAPHDGVLFGRIGAVVVPRERSVDIDDELDFGFAEYLYRKYRQ